MPHPFLPTAMAQPRAWLAALALALLSACQSAPPAAAPVATAAAEPSSPARPTDAATPEPPILGSHTDAHGCKPSTGHAWCERTKSCERPWELALQRGFENTPDGWHAYCDGSTR